MEAEVKALNADIREFKSTHIKGDLGFKIADWNAIYRVSQLEIEDRDVLLDTLREGFQALGIGGSLDWVAAAEGAPQPAAPAPPRRRRGKAQAPSEPVDNPDAFQTGKADGLGGHRDHAARYPNDEILGAAYELGHEAGLRDRHAANGADPTPKRGRGRPRKTTQPDLIDGVGAEA
jgi:hypothetical protein